MTHYFILSSFSISYSLFLFFIFGLSFPHFLLPVKGKIKHTHKHNSLFKLPLYFTVKGESKKKTLTPTSSPFPWILKAQGWGIINIFIFFFFLSSLISFSLCMKVCEVGEEKWFSWDFRDPSVGWSSSGAFASKRSV